MKEYKEIYEIVKNTLSEQRFLHSECVAARCVELAKIYGLDEEIARLIGISHDVAKEMPNNEKIKYCMDNNLDIDDIEQIHPGLLHGKIAADIGAKEYGFTEEMCSAIRCHTTGKANMSKLDKILYVADMSSADRQFPDKGYIIRLANENLDECVKYILKTGINERMEREKKVHLNSLRALNYFLR